MIRKGDIVHIKREWQDPGDSELTWIAIEDQIEGSDTLVIGTVEAAQRFAIPPTHRVKLYMLEMD